MAELNQKKLTQAKVKSLQKEMVKDLRIAFAVMESEFTEILDKAEREQWTIEKLLSTLSNL